MGREALGLMAFFDPGFSSNIGNAIGTMSVRREDAGGWPAHTPGAAGGIAHFGALLAELVSESWNSGDTTLNSAGPRPPAHSR